MVSLINLQVQILNWFASIEANEGK